MNTSSSPGLKALVIFGSAAGTAVLSFILTIVASFVYGPILYTPRQYDFTGVVFPPLAGVIAAGLSFFCTAVPQLLRERRLLNGTARPDDKRFDTIRRLNVCAFIVVNLLHMALLIWANHAASHEPRGTI